MRKNKHLSIEERSIIKSMLDKSASFKAIAWQLGGDCTTISKEVRNHLVFKKTGCFGRPFNDCANRFHCPISNLCSDSACHFKTCSFCSKCHLYCPDYFKQYCPSLSKPPYVCNGCPRRHKCTLEKHLYSASAAQQKYELVRSESRSGIFSARNKFMLAFLRDTNTAASVFLIIEKLYWTLRPDRFMEIFPVLLGNNGSEFSDPPSSRTTKIKYKHQTSITPFTLYKLDRTLIRFVKEFELHNKHNPNY